MEWLANMPVQYLSFAILVTNIVAAICGVVSLIVAVSAFVVAVKTYRLARANKS